MSKIPDFLIEKESEEVTKKELYNRVEKVVGSSHRTSLEFENVAVCRVDKGTHCNEVLGFWVYEDDNPTKFFIIKGLERLKKQKMD